MRAITIVHAIWSAFLIEVEACDDCQGSDVIQTRLVRRAQPGALEALSGPNRPLEWGQINFLHTTDTHGWLSGHVKEPNYGADWGDFLSFAGTMKKKAADLGVDLLVVDTGDLHTGTGLSDAASYSGSASVPNGVVSSDIFVHVDYDLLTIGNHELKNINTSHNIFDKFGKVYGNRYLTSNVDIVHPTTGNWVSIGARYRYFTTPKGLRIMAFGVLYDFTTNAEGTRVRRAVDVVKESWFLNAINYKEHIDMFIILGHNPVNTSNYQSTFSTYYDAIRKDKPDTPIQVFGGHTHHREFVVYDSKSTALSSGRYCETLGWLSISGINSTSSTAKLPLGVPTPSREAKSLLKPKPQVVKSVDPKSSTLLYSRRYIDWNRMSFEYHAKGSQALGLPESGANESTWTAAQHGRALSTMVEFVRKVTKLNDVYGCAPQTWCAECRPTGDSGNIFTLLNEALSTVVVNKTRANIPRIFLYSGGTVRYDLVKGPFTKDDSFIVIPYKNTLQYISNVPYASAAKILPILNAGRWLKHKRATAYHSNLEASLSAKDECSDPHLATGTMLRRSVSKIHYRTAVSPGHTTTDDFGTDGDDTPHSQIDFHKRPNVIQTTTAFPTDGSQPKTVDVIFLSHPDLKIAMLDALKSTGLEYSEKDIGLYMPAAFTTSSVLTEYAKLKWQKNKDDCPLG